MVVILDGLNEMPGRRHDDFSTEGPALNRRNILYSFRHGLGCLAGRTHESGL